MVLTDSEEDSSQYEDDWDEQPLLFEDVTFAVESQLEQIESLVSNDSFEAERQFRKLLEKPGLDSSWRIKILSRLLRLPTIDIHRRIGDFLEILNIAKTEEDELKSDFVLLAIDALEDRETTSDLSIYRVLKDAYLNGAQVALQLNHKRAWRRAVLRAAILASEVEDAETARHLTRLLLTEYVVGSLVHEPGTDAAWEDDWFAAVQLETGGAADEAHRAALLDLEFRVSGKLTEKEDGWRLERILPALRYTYKAVLDRKISASLNARAALYLAKKGRFSQALRACYETVAAHFALATCSGRKVESLDTARRFLVLQIVFGRLAGEGTANFDPLSTREARALLEKDEELGVERKFSALNTKALLDRLEAAFSHPAELERCLSEHADLFGDDPVLCQIVKSSLMRHARIAWLSARVNKHILTIPLMQAELCLPASEAVALAVYNSDETKAGSPSRVEIRSQTLALVEEQSRPVDHVVQTLEDLSEGIQSSLLLGLKFFK